MFFFFIIIIDLKNTIHIFLKIWLKYSFCENYF